MSIILDALKKSETERQQQGHAEFGQMPIRASARRAPVWIWIVAALLAINLLVLLGMYFKPSSQTLGEAIESTPVAPMPDSSTPAEMSPTRSSFTEQLERVKPLPPKETPATAAAQKSEGTDIAARDAPRASVVEQLTGSNAGMPDIDQLRASGELSIGEQRLDIHVFSETPANRFVFINMTKLREGATTGDGVTVEEITQDGVVLNYQGRRFFLARQ